MSEETPEPDADAYRVPEDYEELVREWGGLIHCCIARLNRKPRQALDLKQHIFMELLRVDVIGKFQASPKFPDKSAEMFKRYLCKSVHNMFCNWCRTWYRRHRAFSDTTWSELPEER